MRHCVSLSACQTFNILSAQFKITIWTWWECLPPSQPLWYASTNVTSMTNWRHDDRHNEKSDLICSFQSWYEPTWLYLVWFLLVSTGSLNRIINTNNDSVSSSCWWRTKHKHWFHVIVVPDFWVLTPFSCLWPNFIWYFVSCEPAPHILRSCLAWVDITVWHVMSDSMGASQCQLH